MHRLISTIFIIGLTSVIFAQEKCELNTQIGQSHHTTIVSPIFDNNQSSPSGPLTPSALGDQLIYFVHGLAGTPNTWATAGQAVEFNYKTTHTRPTYSEFSLAGAGQDLHHAMVAAAPEREINGIEDPSTCFIISSSQGGLVSRSANKLYSDIPAFEADRQFGGIVTFGTPHQGALIVNNTPDLTDILSEACQSLSSPEIQAEIQNIPLVNLFLNGDTIDEVVSEICDLLATGVATFGLGGFQAPITNDYRVGAPNLASLNSFSSTDDLPKIAFYGIEEEPVLWRTIFSFANNPNASPAFTANYDEAFVNVSNELMLTYYNKFVEWGIAYETAISDECKWWQWAICPACCLGVEIVNGWLENEDDIRNIRDDYFRGYRFLRDVNDQYKVAIGGLELQQVNNGYSCVCEYESDSEMGVQIFQTATASECLDNNGYSNGEEIFCTSYANISFNRIEHPNDGVVPAYSAGDFPGGITHAPNGSEINRIMEKTNHQQMKNNSELRVKLEMLFNGEDVDEFFFIEER